MIISVAVITYNSSSTVKQTLNSILNQDYNSKNIELVISDDASKDNTVSTIESWIFDNEKEFSNIKFLKNQENLGVSANFNEACKACTSEWIKPIAGDDILESNCIRENFNYIDNNKDCKVLFSKMRWFGSVDKVTPEVHNINFFSQTSAQQNKRLKYFSFNFAPTGFINRKALESIGYANEAYRTIEDLPLWLKFTSAGYKLYFLDCITVNYRVGDSISMSNSQHINFAFLDDLIAINKEGASSFIKSPKQELIRREQLILYKSNRLVGKLFKNRKNKVTRFIRYIPWFFMPIHNLHYLKTKILYRKDK